MVKTGIAPEDRRRPVEEDSGRIVTTPFGAAFWPVWTGEWAKIGIEAADHQRPAEVDSGRIGTTPFEAAFWPVWTGE